MSKKTVVRVDDRLNSPTGDPPKTAAERVKDRMEGMSKSDLAEVKITLLHEWVATIKSALIATTVISRDDDGIETIVKKLEMGVPSNNMLVFLIDGLERVIAGESTLLG
jgi:hypothetical protein